MQNIKVRSQNLLAIIFLVFLFLSLVPNLALGADQPHCANLLPEKKTGGLIPCGRSCNDPSTLGIDETKACGFCDVFVLTNNILQFLLTKVLTSVAVLMFVIGGAYFLIAGSSPQLLTKGKTILTAAAIGLVIILASYVFMNTLFMYIGVAKWTGLTIVAEGKIETTSKGDSINFNPPGLTDKGEAWNPGDFTGFPIMIRKGPGSPQTKIVSGNTADTININTEDPWIQVGGSSPGNGSEYSIGGKWFNVICK